MWEGTAGDVKHACNASSRKLAGDGATRGQRLERAWSAGVARPGVTACARRAVPSRASRLSYASKPIRELHCALPAARVPPRALRAMPWRVCVRHASTRSLDFRLHPIAEG